MFCRQVFSRTVLAWNLMPSSLILGLLLILLFSACEGVDGDIRGVEESDANILTPSNYSSDREPSTVSLPSNSATGTALVESSGQGEPAATLRLPGGATATLNMRIYLSDTVVLARFLSSGNNELRFRALEYLKGAGSTEFAVSADTTDRNSEWDSRETILFLSTVEEDTVGTRSDETAFIFADTVPEAYDEFHDSYFNPSLPAGYTIGKRNPVWLPLLETTTSSRSATEEKLFIIEILSPTGVTEPSVSLSELRSQIAWQEGGDGIEGYDSCISFGLQYEQYFRHIEESRGASYNQPPHPPAKRELTSGFGEGVIINEFAFSNRASYDKMWIEGGQSHLFDRSIVDDDEVPSNRYSSEITTTRPLAQGLYTFTSRNTPYYLLPCGFDAIYNRLDWEVAIVAPTGTLHEAFFNPVALSGGGVGATGSSGVIDPDGFTVGSDDVEIDGLEWRSGSVVLELDDYVSLSGQTLDFIELDGSIDTIAGHRGRDGESDGRYVDVDCVEPALARWRPADAAHPRLEHNSAAATTSATSAAACDAHPNADCHTDTADPRRRRHLSLPSRGRWSRGSSCC